MTNFGRLIISYILELIAIVGLFHFAGWEVAVCVVLYVWGHNIRYHPEITQGV